MTEPGPDAQADDLLTQWRQRTDTALTALLDTRHDLAPRLHDAMRHAVLLGGKRMRPLLVYASGRACDATTDALDGAAMAVELIHAYSLVHDDLPAMDNDALRRGQPTVHVAFDEATAILAGDALQALAFAVLCDVPVSDRQRVAMLRELSRAAGAQGMCAGQALDIAATGQPQRIDAAALERLHQLKTGALVRAAVRLGAIAADADAATADALDRYAEALGLGFQVRDDLLDVEADSATLGKTAGKDQAQDKATFPSVLGMTASRAHLAALAARMHDALAGLDTRADALRLLARFAVERSH